ncbi:MAG: MlaD family protein [Spirochaetales bacterium]|nr:MlaD family protein [Spirochaetales bacterium]
MKFKFRHADKIVGLFTLVAMLLVLMIIIFAGVNKRWFTKRVSFRSLFTSAEGLEVGMPVNLRGFEIGRVRSLELNQENQVDLTFSIYEEYHNRIMPDSVLVLPSGLLGAGGALDLYPGKKEGEPLVAESYVPSTQTVEGKMLVKTRRVDRPDNADPVTAVLTELPGTLENVNRTLEGLSVLMETARRGIRGQGNEPLAQVMRHVEQTTEELAAGAAHARELSHSLAQLAAELESPQGLVPTLLDPQGSLATLLNDDGELWTSIMSILEQLEGSAQDVHSLSASLSGMSPRIGLALDGTIGALSEALKVMEGLKNNPLLRGGISEDGPVEQGKLDLREEEF